MISYAPAFLGQVPVRPIRMGQQLKVLGQNASQVWFDRAKAAHTEFENLRLRARAFPLTSDKYEKERDWYNQAYALAGKPWLPVHSALSWEDPSMFADANLQGAVDRLEVFNERYEAFLSDLEAEVPDQEQAESEPSPATKGFPTWAYVVGVVAAIGAVGYLATRES